MVTKNWPFSDFDPDNITTYPTARSICKSGRFTAEERKAEYKRRGKGPAVVIEGEYNDTYCDPGNDYNDFERNWDVDA